MKKFAALTLTCLLAFAVILSTGCLARKDAIRFRYWGDTEEVKITEGLLREFEALHPGVKVRGERKNADLYADVLLLEATDNSAPDVMFVSTDTFDSIQGSGILADLGPFLDKEKELKATDYYPMMTRRFSTDGKLLALPAGIGPISLVYYNKDLLAAAKLPTPKDSWTWEDLRHDAIAMTKRDGAGHGQQFGYGEDWNMDESWALAAGGGIVDDYFKPSRLTCASPDSVAGILFRWKLMQQDLVMPNVSDTQSLNSSNLALFTNGKLGFFMSGVWHITSFRNIKDFKWDVAPFPLRPGHHGRYISGGAGYAMNKNTKDPAMVWQLIKFIAGKEGQTRIAATGLGQPALKQLSESPVFLDGREPQNKKILLGAAENCVPNSVWPQWREFHSNLWIPATDPLWLPGYKDGESGVVKVLRDIEAKGNAKYFSKK